MPPKQAQALVRDRDVASIEATRPIRDALLWNFTVLGEAAAHISDDFREAHPSIDWSRPSQLRNRIVHGYWSIDMEILFATANNDLPHFVAQLQAPLSGLEP